MRRLLTIMLLGATMATQAFTVYVNTPQGSQAYDSANIENISFPGEGVATLTLTDNSTVKAYNLVSITFDQTGTGAGITDVDLDNVNTFQISNAEVSTIDNSPLSIYSIDGKLVKHSANGYCDLRNLVTGTYILKSATSTTKLLVK